MLLLADDAGITFGTEPPSIAGDNSDFPFPIVRQQFSA